MAGHSAPTPYDVRVALPGDASRIAEVHVASWRSAYAGLLPQHVLDGQSVADRARAFYERQRWRPDGATVCFP